MRTKFDIGFRVIKVNTSNMKSDALRALLANLLERWEGEVVEFKRAGDVFSTSDIGEYFSALANEVNLRNEEKAWPVFGVDNKSRKIVGTDYRPERERDHKIGNLLSRMRRAGMIENLGARKSSRWVMNVEKEKKAPR